MILEGPKTTSLYIFFYAGAFIISLNVGVVEQVAIVCTKILTFYCWYSLCNFGEQ